MYSLLIINIGSTSTKVGVFLDEKPLFIQTTDHSRKELSAFPIFNDQYDFRKKAIEGIFRQWRVDWKDIDLM